MQTFVQELRVSIVMLIEVQTLIKAVESNMCTRCYYYCHHYYVEYLRLLNIFTCLHRILKPYTLTFPLYMSTIARTKKSERNMCKQNVKEPELSMKSNFLYTEREETLTKNRSGHSL